MMQLFKSSTKETMNFLRYVGPGLLVTVGFIDPGNWASNIAAGSGYGYTYYGWSHYQRSCSLSYSIMQPT